MSLRDKNDHFIATGDWTRKMREHAEYVLIHRVLRGIGDRRMRCFRMNITLCIHKGATQSEIRRAPYRWQTAPATHLAGGPVEVLWSRGAPDVVSAYPCQNPGHQSIYPLRPDLWLPVDCGQCGPCRARLAYEENLSCSSISSPTASRTPTSVTPSRAISS